MPLSRSRRLTRCAVLPFVVAFAVPGAAAAAQPADPELAARAAATPTTIAAGRRALLKNARTFTRRSKCPVRVRRARYIGSVKASNRTKSAKRIADTSDFAVVAKSGKCTGTRTLASARRSGKVKASLVAAYRKQIRSRLKRGTLLYRLSWRRTNGRRFSTIAAVSPKRALQFDSLISTFLKAAPDSRSPAPAQPTQGATTRQAPGPAVTRITWRPWGATGRCIVVDLLNFCRVRKFVSMLIFVNAYGRITAEAETASVSATLANAKRRIKAEIINDGKCKKFTVETYWTSPIGSIKVGAAAKGFDVSLTIGGIGSNGIDSEVYILCGDGSGQILD